MVKACATDARPEKVTGLYHVLLAVGRVDHRARGNTPRWMVVRMRVRVRLYSTMNIVQRGVGVDRRAS
jgi:hypothetical protein